MDNVIIHGTNVVEQMENFIVPMTADAKVQLPLLPPVVVLYVILQQANGFHHNTTAANQMLDGLVPPIVVDILLRVALRRPPIRVRMIVQFVGAAHLEVVAIVAIISVTHWGVVLVYHVVLGIVLLAQVDNVVTEYQEPVKIHVHARVRQQLWARY